MGKTEAVAITTLECQECGSEIYVCDLCKDYFIRGEILYCTDDDKHYHESCYDKEMNRYEM